MSAIVTILGLLLVVTMLANYLGTQLPAQMSVNDTNHELAVEDQVARLAASMQAIAGAGRDGGLLSQPVSLGSSGAPPFAAPDEASIGAGATGSDLTETFTVLGPSVYAPPTVGPAGGTTAGDSCTTSSTSLICSGSSTVVWNFTSSTPTTLTVTTSGGPYYVSASVSNTTIDETASSTNPIYLTVIGNYDTIDVTISGSSTVVRIVLVGNYDQVNFAASSWSSSTVSVYAVGNHNSVSVGAMSASNSQFTATFFGSNDTVGLSTVSASSSTFNVNFNGFVPSSPGASCPVDNLAASTDTLSGPSTYSGGTYDVTYNDTSVSSGTAPSPWAGTWAEPAPFACPFYSQLSLPQRDSGAVGASFVVYLMNKYEPSAEVAYDQGAVIYAQANGAPLVLVGPGLNYTHGTLTLWIPEFVQRLGTEVGSGTAELTARLTSVLSVVLPSDGVQLGGTYLWMNVTTAYAQAWLQYLGTYVGETALKGVATVTCVPAGGAACKGPFAFNGPLGTVTLRVPVSALSGLKLTVATFALGLR